MFSNFYDANFKYIWKVNRKQRNATAVTFHNRKTFNVIFFTKSNIEFGNIRTRVSVRKSEFTTQQKLLLTLRISFTLLSTMKIICILLLATLVLAAVTIVDSQCGASGSCVGVGGAKLCNDRCKKCYGPSGYYTSGSCGGLLWQTCQCFYG